MSKVGWFKQTDGRTRPNLRHSSLTRSVNVILTTVVAYSVSRVRVIAICTHKRRTRMINTGNQRGRSLLKAAARAFAARSLAASPEGYTASHISRVVVLVWIPRRRRLGRYRRALVSLRYLSGRHRPPRKQPNSVLCEWRLMCVCVPLRVSLLSTIVSQSRSASRPMRV